MMNQIFRQLSAMQSREPDAPEKTSITLEEADAANRAMLNHQQLVCSELDRICGRINIIAGGHSERRPICTL